MFKFIGFLTALFIIVNIAITSPFTGAFLGAIWMMFISRSLARKHRKFTPVPVQKKVSNQKYDWEEDDWGSLGTPSVLSSDPLTRSFLSDD